MKKYIAIYLLIIPISLFAQSAQEVIESGQDLNVLYRNEQSFYGFLNTRGWGVGYRRGKHISAKFKAIFEIEAASLKHPKEIKLRGTSDTKSRFIYGKIYTPMILRIGAGNQQVLFKRTDRKAVEIRAIYLIEGNITFAKPYYVQIIGESSFRNTPIVRYDPEKVPIDSIVGRGGFLYGFDEISIYPAITGKFILSVEYASLSYKIRAIDVGIVVDYYPRALPIMANNPAENYIITLQVGLVFGKKWF